MKVFEYFTGKTPGEIKTRNVTVTTTSASLEELLGHALQKTLYSLTLIPDGTIYWNTEGNDASAATPELEKITFNGITKEKADKHRFYASSVDMQVIEEG